MSIECGPDGLDDFVRSSRHVGIGEVEDDPSGEEELVPSLVVTLVHIGSQVDLALGLDPDPVLGICEVEEGAGSVGTLYMELVDRRR